MSGAMVAAGIGAAGLVGGGLIGSHSASTAANDQSSAANHAADLNYQASQNALAFQKQQYNQNQANFAPWLQAGQGGLSQLQYMMGLGSSTPNAPSSNAVNTGMGSFAGGGMPGGASPINTGMGSAGGSFPVRPVGGQPGGGMGSARAMSVPGTGMAGAGGAMPVHAIGGQPGTGMASASGNLSALQGGVRPAAGGPMMPYNPVGGQPSGGMGGAPSTGMGGGAPSVNTSLGGFGSLMQPYGQQFQAPTGLTMQNDPGYQARMNLGTDAIQRSAAARGGVLTGGTAKALDQFGQDYGSNEYGNVYNRAFNEHAQNYNEYNQNQANQYNKLAALAGIGQQTAGQLGYLGQQSANGISNNLLDTANAMGQNYQNAGAANAQGAYNSGQAWNGAIGSGVSGLSQLYQLQQLQKMQQPATNTDWVGIW